MGALTPQEIEEIERISRFARQPLIQSWRDWYALLRPLVKKTDPLHTHKPSLSIVLEPLLGRMSEDSRTGVRRNMPLGREESLVVFAEALEIAEVFGDAGDLTLIAASRRQVSEDDLPGFDEKLFELVHASDLGPVEINRIADRMPPKARVKRQLQAWALGKVFPKIEAEEEKLAA
jgi:hypothetical protein